MRIQFTFYGRAIPAHALRGVLAALGAAVAIFFAMLPFYDRMSDGLRTGLAWSVAGILTVAANKFRKAMKRAPPAQMTQSAALLKGTPPARAIRSGQMDYLIGHAVKITMRNGSTIVGVFDGLDDSLEQVSILNATVTLMESFDIGPSQKDQWSVYVSEIQKIMKVDDSQSQQAPPAYSGAAAAPIEPEA